MDTFGVMLIIAGAAVLAGAALGFYTAYRDITRDKSRAWEAGYTEGAADTLSNQSTATHYHTPNPYMEGTR